jgi:glycosyltransferase involved in cell wall biosynthesis
MNVTVIIPTLASEKTKPFLKICVESLRKTVDWDIIVVSNGTSNKPGLTDIHGISKHIHTPTQGQCLATNYGVQLVRPDTDYILVSNDDMYYPKGWNEHLRFDYPVFSPNLIEPTNNAGSAPPFIKLDAGLTIEGFKKDIVDDFMKIPFTKKYGGAAPKDESGFNLPFFIERGFWNLLGGYDTAYDPWGSNSDTDLQTRINLAGVTPIRLRDVLVYHFSNKSGTFDGSHQDFYQNNLEYFKDKFGFDRDELKSDVWYNADMIPEDKSKIKYEQRKYEKS